jgi:cardiolipin synthase
MAAPRDDRKRHLPAWLTVPNSLTFVRILLTPFFGYFWWHRQFLLALAIFIIASVSDVLDGLLARLLDQRTKLGQLLDPGADKFMVLVAIIAAAATGAVPRWLAALVIGRDAILASSGALFAFVFRGIHGPEGWAPTRLGKYATFFTLGAIGVALAWEITEYQPLRGFIGALGILSAFTTVVSGGQYIVNGARAVLRGAKLAPGGDHA